MSCKSLCIGLVFFLFYSFSSHPLAGFELLPAETRKLTNDEYRNRKASWSADGRYLIYEGLLRGRSFMMMLDTHTGETQQLAEHLYQKSGYENSSAFVWHPKEPWFAGSVTAAGDYNLMLFQLGGGFLGIFLGDDYIKKRILNDDAGWQGDPRFFPSGESLLFVNAAEGDGDIWLAKVPRGGSTPLIEAAGMDYAPDLAPGSDAFIFTSRRSGEDQLYHQRLDNGGAIIGDADPLPGIPEGVSYGTYGDRGKIVAYQGTSLMEIDPEAKTFKTLAEGVFLEQRPALQPRGDLVAFIASLSDEKPLMLTDRKHGSLVKVDTGLLYQERPVWTPDGKNLVVEGYDGLWWNLYLVEIPDDL